MKNRVLMSQWSKIAASAALALALALYPKPGNAVPVWAYSAQYEFVTITGATIVAASAFGEGESTAHLVQGFVDYGAEDNQNSGSGPVSAPQAMSGPGPFPPNFTVQPQGITLGGARGDQGVNAASKGGPDAAGVAEVYLEGPGSGSATAENSAFIRLEQTAPVITFTIDAASELAVLTTAPGDTSQAQTKLSLKLIGPSNVPGIQPRTAIWNPCGSTAPADQPNLNNCNQPGNGLIEQFNAPPPTLTVKSDPASLNNSITCTDAGCFNDYLAAFDTWTLTADFGVGNVLAADFNTYNQVLVSGLQDVGLAALPNIPSIVAEPDSLPILSVALAGLLVLGMRHRLR